MEKLDLKFQLPLPLSPPKIVSLFYSVEIFSTMLRDAMI